MYQHILLPIDGSPASAGAVQSALQFAREAGARVTALYVLPDIHAYEYTIETQERIHEAYLRETAAWAHRVLEELAAQAKALGVPCDTMACHGDRPHEQIVDIAGSHGCDLIAMATHGRSGLERMLLGSVTHKVLINATVPVLVFHASRPGRTAA